MVLVVQVATVGWLLLLAILHFRRGRRQRQDDEMLSGDRAISYLLPVIPLGAAVALAIAWGW